MALEIEIELENPLYILSKIAIVILSYPVIDSSVEHQSQGVMELINELCELLQSHTNRDKVVSLATFVLKLWGATARREDLLTASSRLFAARATLRLFDDAAAVKGLLAYGLGRQDGLIWGTIGVSSGVFKLAYLQAQKLVFLSEAGVLVLSKEAEFRIKTAHKVFWSLSAFALLLKSIRALHTTAEALHSPKRTRCARARVTQASLLTTKLLCDVIHAVSWLPPGWLWGTALTTQQVGAVATAAAVADLVAYYHGKRLTKKQ